MTSYSDSFDSRQSSGGEQVFVKLRSQLLAANGGIYDDAIDVEKLGEAGRKHQAPASARCPG
jgi:hypothetical protein